VRPLPHLQSLTIHESTLDVTAFLADFCQCQTSELEEVMINSGRAVSPLPIDASFPVSVSKLGLIGIEWCDHNFERLFTVLSNKSNFKQMFVLDVSRTKLSSDQWRALDQFLIGFKFDGLRAIYWDGNCIGQGICELIAQNSSLRFLSLCGCAIDSPKAVALICRFITRIRGLVSLCLAGSKTNNYRDALEPFFDAILKNRSIHSLDIGGNHYGDGILGLLQKLFDIHQKIREVIFDGNDVTDLDGVRSLYEVAGRIERRIVLRFPGEDVERLRASNRINEQDVHRLRIQCSDALRHSRKPSKASPPPSNQSEDNTSDGGLAGAIERAAAVASRDKCEFIDLIVRRSGMSEGEGQTLPPELQEIVDRQNDDYVQDDQWEAFMDDIPDVPVEWELMQMLDQFSLGNLVKALAG
jgi:hypothetical protein